MLKKYQPGLPPKAFALTGQKAGVGATWLIQTQATSSSSSIMSNSFDAALIRLENKIENGVRTIPPTANPGPLGLYGFALTTFLLQGVFTTIVGATSAHLVYAFGFFFGGLAQFTAGVLEYQRKNTFATVAFCCFGAFWMSVALHGTLRAAGIYTANIEGEEMMLSLWSFLTFCLWLCTFNANLAISALFFTLSLLFAFLAAGQRHETMLKFSGGWGIFVAMIAFYAGTAALMEDVYGRPILPVFPFASIDQSSHRKTSAKDVCDVEAA